MKEPAKDVTVVLVHGWAGHGLLMSYLAWRLRAEGYATVSFSYPSVRKTPVESAALLMKRLATIQSPVIHFVGHSLGGIVLLHLLRLSSPLEQSKLVLLGVPVQGSAMAFRARKSWLGAMLLGRLADSSETRPLRVARLPEKPRACSIGSIVGINGFSLTGHLFGGTRRGDGVVETDETLIAGAHRCEVKCSHTRMLVSRLCADEMICFLRRGVFSSENVKMNGHK